MTHGLAWIGEQACRGIPWAEDRRSGERPANSERGIVPAEALFVARRVELGRLVEHLGHVREHEEPVGQALGHPPLPAFLGGEFDPFAAAWVCRLQRSCPKA